MNQRLRVDRDDPWILGYAAGLAAAWRVNQSDSMVKYALSGDGLTIEMLRFVGVESFDLDVLERAATAGGV